MKCLHHSDADGKCAAYWVAKRYNNFNPNDFIMIDYGIDVNYRSKIQENELVYIVDFSLEVEEFKKLLEITPNIVWIDHHITAINKYKDFEKKNKIKGLRYNGVAGCMLTYCYFNKMNDGRLPFNKDMVNSAPWFTKFIADYDVWAFEFDETKHFKLGLDACGEILPCDVIWRQLENIGKVRELIANGIIIEKYRDSIAKEACSSNGFVKQFEGYNVFFLNTCLGGSSWFGDRIDEYDIVCSFHKTKEGKWSYSLYSNKIETTTISTKYGGGGHAGASGFTLDSPLPVTL
jgi:oligoribonuclease NrnB/cAMP/cGMP phosphodiesterase (DHH superfamily)